MIPPPLLVAGGYLLYKLVENVDTKKRALEKASPETSEKKAAPKTSEKKQKTEVDQDLVYSARFTADDDEKEDNENVPDKKKIDTDKKKIDAAKMDQFVFIRDKIYFYRVKGDGKCLFRAIVAALYYMQDNVVDLLLSEQTTKANDLRKQIVTFMFNNPEKFENAPEKDESFKKYCDEMMNLNAMGGHTEVCAFHIMTGIQIDVYHLENETLTIMQSINEHCKDDVKDVVRLFYNGKDHWDMLYVTE
jgi:hypothetical protein